MSESNQESTDLDLTSANLEIMIKVLTSATPPKEDGTTPKQAAGIIRRTLGTNQMQAMLKKEAETENQHLQDLARKAHAYTSLYFEHHKE